MKVDNSIILAAKFLAATFVIMAGSSAVINSISEDFYKEWGGLVIVFSWWFTICLTLVFSKKVLFWEWPYFKGTERFRGIAGLIVGLIGLLILLLAKG